MWEGKESAGHDTVAQSLNMPLWSWLELLEWARVLVPGHAGNNHAYFGMVESGEGQQTAMGGNGYMATNDAVQLMQQRIDQLYAQVDAQQQRIAALEAIAQQVAGFPNDGDWCDRCPFCEGPEVWGGSMEHTAECPVTQARVLYPTPPEG
jgi:hypothetical protein